MVTNAGSVLVGRELGDGELIRLLKGAKGDPAPATKGLAAAALSLLTGEQASTLVNKLAEMNSDRTPKKKQSRRKQR